MSSEVKRQYADGAAVGQRLTERTEPANIMGFRGRSRFLAYALLIAVFCFGR